MNTLYVRTPAQKAIFEQELQGQLSDGNWENDQTDSRLWDCEVVVSNDQIGPSFKPKYPVNFNDDVILEVVSDRMIEYAQKVDPSYDMEKLVKDLDELTVIVYG